ncbi:endogenous retrovirus group FC1 Env polyprotein-like [Pipistrellus kuhlii]|uniref:endogenous retrovirus group FC1 Env polyprotein-like n=1 Tax=Pipistrellus kuhlii TaxID=59472 RepID=UPI00174F3A53|nr:endogenous retrovirus group FC1 Env polyprotein-like [Pipistrellus kuhlii]
MSEVEILIAVDFRSVSKSCRPYACFAYDQRDPDRCNRDVNTYGGCRWSDCVIHDAYKEVRSGPFFWKDGTFNIRVRDPWDQRWAVGVMGRLYGDGWSSTPSGTIYISREYVMAQEAQLQVSNSSLQAEHPLKGKLPDSPREEVLSSWLQLIQHTLLFLNETRTLPNVSHCFLCVSLQRPLLAAVPLVTPVGTQGHGECQPPLTGIPLWEPETPEPTLPPRICYQTSNPVTVGRVTWNCTQSHTAASPTKASPGTFFWCNGTVSNCINSSDPGPCFVVTVVPQLTLYGESELAWLRPSSQPRARRAAFPPVKLGVSIAASVGLPGGSLGNSIISAQDFNDKLQIALDSTTASLASPQRQGTSVAQIALRNRQRALDLLTAEKGGTCMLLQKECCYYINKSGVVEQNLEALTKLSEELHAHSRDNSLFRWLQSPSATWILPLIGLLILICVFLSLAPCLLKCIRSRMDGGNVSSDCKPASALSLHLVALQPASA